MAMNFHHLDDETRKHMLLEIEKDVQEGTLYISPRLTEACAQEYAQLLTKAATDGHDEAFGAELAIPGRLNTHEPRKTKSGSTMVKVPVTAAQTLSEGEFNRFFMRGLCARAKAEGTTHVVIYRAKHVANPRPESEVMIGTQMEVTQLLNDLREHIGTDTALGLPPGPNSGLSIRLPR